MGVEYARYLLPRPCSFRPPANVLVRLVATLREQAWLPNRRTRNLASLRSPIRGLHGGALGLAERRAAWTTPAEFRSAGFSILPDPLTAEWLDENVDMRLRWPVHPDGRADEIDESDGEDLLRALYGLRYPLVTIADEGDVPYYDLSIHWANDYIVPVYRETMSTEVASVCSCGAELARSENDISKNMRAPFQTRVALSCPRCGRPFEAERTTTTLRAGFDQRETTLDEGGVVHRFAIHVDCGKCIPREPPERAFHPDLKALCESVLGVPMVEAGYVY